MKVLGIDIGGSAIKGAPVDTATGRLLADRFKIETPLLLSPTEMADAAGMIAAHFRWRGPVGIGFPGVIHGSMILTSANLDKKFIGCDGIKLFSNAIGLPVALTNDAAAAGLAEMRFGDAAELRREGAHAHAGHRRRLRALLPGRPFPVRARATCRWTAATPRSAWPPR